MNTLRDQTPSRGVFSDADHGTLGGKSVTYFGNHYLDLCFLLLGPLLLLRHLPPVQPTAAKWAASMPVTPLADCSGHIVKERST